jgi:hypothetical protein
MNGKTFGEVICSLVILIAGYELVGLLTPLPTISRVLQGWRDAPGSNLGVWVVVVILLTIINLFSAWLFHHLLFSPRSTL